MKAPTILSKLATIHRTRVARILLLGATALAVTLVIPALLGPVAAFANGVMQDIFRPFRDDAGIIRSQPSDVKVTTVTGTVVQVPDAPLDARNKFFDPALGATGQSCASCHQPDQGFTIQVQDIQRRFAESGGKDPLFHFRNTADNPAKGEPTAQNYSVVLALGATRIAKRYSADSNFTIVAADQRTIDKFGTFPLTNDPEMDRFPGGATDQNPTISAFRRPIVPTNLHLESAVLFDGAVDIANIFGQVTGGNMLLAGRDPTPEEAKEVGAFEFGVFTDQNFDRAAAPVGAGFTSNAGGRGGPLNLRNLALGPNISCNEPAEANLVQTSTLSGAGTCVPNVPGFDIFDAWTNLPGGGLNIGRRSVARGQEIFNTKTLHVPPDLQAQLGSTTTTCSGCHSKRNVGNNVDRTFFVRVGTDSIAIIEDLIKGGGACATDKKAHPGLQSMLDRVQMLPLYRVTAKTGTIAPGCGVSDTGEIITTDPGRAMVSGDVADTGKFRPVILRGLAARSPYFHAGAAKDIRTLIEFYEARFSIGFTEQEERDLEAFLESL